MQVRRVYTEYIKPDDPRHWRLKIYSQVSARLYNKALRLALTVEKRIRVQAKAGHFYGKRMNFYDLYSYAQSYFKDEYAACPEGQSVLAQVAQDLESYWKAKAAFFKNPKKFSGKPRAPRQKDGGCVTTVPAVKIRKDSTYIYRPRSHAIRVNVPKAGSYTKLNQIRFVPKGDGFNIEVVYTAEVEVESKDRSGFLALDPGVVNLYTGVSDKDTAPVIVDGSRLLGTIKYYNFKIDRLKSQLPEGQKSSKQIRKLWTRLNHKKKHYVHCATKKIVSYADSISAKTVIVGKNDGQKKENRLKWFNKMNHTEILEILKYKLEAKGIVLEEVEESYTSKTDNLAKQFLPKIAAGKSNKPADWKPLGERVKRGLYQSSTGVLLNADVNGAIGIARKLIGDEWIAGGYFCNPVRLR